MTEARGQTIEEDGDEVFTPISAGCNACGGYWLDGKRHNYAIKPDGLWLKCVNCHGSYGAVPPCWYCAASADETCQRPFKDAPCERAGLSSKRLPHGDAHDK